MSYDTRLMPPGSSFGTSANMIGLDNLVQLKSSVMTHPDSNVESHGSPNDTNLKGGLSLTFDTMDNLPDNGMSTFHKTSTHTTHSSSMLDDTTSFHQTQITPISLENKPMHSILPHYNVFNPEFTYERKDAIQDTIDRLNNEVISFDFEDFENAILLPLPQLARILDCPRNEAHSFRRKVIKEIDHTRRLAFTTEKIMTIKHTAETVLINIQAELDAYGEPPYHRAVGAEVLRLQHKWFTAKELIENTTKLLSKA